MKTSAIIIHWNTPKELEQQLDQLKPSQKLEIIIVDNASDETVELDRSLHQLKHMNLIKNKKNLGFATACNQGAKMAKGEWLLFLNPDTHISTRDVVEFVKKAELKNLDAASPKQEGEDYYKPLPTWFSLLVEFSPLRRLIPLSFFKKHTLFGGCLLIKKEVLNKLGGWDEDFFLWFEDSDLTKRLYDAGYKIGWLPVTYSHSGGSSFKKLKESKRLELFFDSMNLYAKKHFNLFGQLVVKAISWWNLKATSSMLHVT